MGSLSFDCFLSHFLSGDASFSLSFRSSLCSLLVLVDFSASSSLSLKGIKLLLESRGLLDRDGEQRGFFRLDLDDCAVSPFNHVVGELDGFLIALVTYTLQRHHLVLALSKDVLEQVDIYRCGSTANQQDVAVRRRVFGGVFAIFLLFLAVSCLASVVSSWLA